MEPSARQVLLLGKGAAAAPASIYHPAAEAIFASFTTPPSDARKIRINDYVVAGLAGGWWGKFDVKHEYMAADSQAALINWAQPGTYNGVAVNSPTFTADVGFTGASSKYIDTGFNPTTAPSPKFVRNSASAFVWGTSAANINAGAFGSLAVGTGRSYIYPHSWDGGLYVTANQNSWVNVVVAGGEQLAAFSRTDANTLVGYINGVSVVSSGAKASEAPLNSNFVFLQEGGTFYTAMIRSGGILSQLSAAEQLSLYQAELAYQAGIATDKIIAAFTTPPTVGRKTLIYQYVYDMMAAGAWTDGDADYWFAAADAQASLINLVNPGTYNAVAVNSPTFTADQGWTGASTKYLDTGFNPTTAPTPKFVQNSGCASVWSNTSGVIAGAAMGGSSGGGDWSSIYPRFTGDHFYSRIGQNTTNIDVVSIDGSGYFSVSRSASNLTTAYKSGVSGGTGATASTGVDNTNLRFLAGSATPWAGQVASGNFGASRDATKQLAVYNAKRAYATGVGIP